nr:hypothetical protein [Tanacetum cinerariifolium]
MPNESVLLLTKQTLNVWMTMLKTEKEVIEFGDSYKAPPEETNKGPTGTKITIQGSDVAGFDKSKVECSNCHKMGHLARECRAPKSQDRGKRESYKQGPKEEKPAPKALMADIC